MSIQPLLADAYTWGPQAWLVSLMGMPLKDDQPALAGWRETGPALVPNTQQDPCERWRATQSCERP